MKVRTNLLSEDTIETLFKNNNRCIEFLNELLDHRENKLNKSTNIYHTSRYCTHKSLNLLVCGGCSSKTKLRTGNVTCIDVNSPRYVGTYQPMITARDSSNLVYVKGDLFVFGGYDCNRRWVISVEKYSLASKTWSQVAEMYDNRKGFCTCAFMNEVFVFGGERYNGRPFYGNYVRMNSCLKFGTCDYSWKEVSKMKEARNVAACAVFEDRIVVSGGCRLVDGNFIDLKTVESYDVVPDKWSPMPNMNYGKSLHSLVVVKNKLFAISQTASTFEVFDNNSKTFVVLSPPKLKYSCNAISIESKIVFLENFQNKVCLYDVDKNEWSEKQCEVTKNIRSFSCVKIPFL